MDSELILKKFDEIETKVERLVEVIKSLEATNLELKNQNDSLNEGLQSKINAEKSYNEEMPIFWITEGSIGSTCYDNTLWEALYI